MNVITEHGVYWLCIVLMMTGFYIVILWDYFVKKIMGLNIFQVAVIMFYVIMGKIEGGTVFIFYVHGSELVDVVYSNLFLYVLMLIVIVVGVVIIVLGFVLVVCI